MLQNFHFNGIDVDNIREAQFLEMQLLKINFLDEPMEKERVTQIVCSILERFNSESLGFVNTESDDFFNDTPIQQFEGLCTIYDISELATLECIRSSLHLLRSKATRAFPNTLILLNSLN